ncbi:MAG: mandelate racemase/muconate lactonizing enzyme family protein [Candidatus Rokuibacteriota bacterium]
MKIARVDLIPLRLPLRRVLTLPRGASRTLDEGKRLLLVRVETEDGRAGWGEASPSRRWSAETLESALTSLERYLAPAVVGRDPRDLAAVHAAMDQELAPGFDQGQPIAKAAIDFACHDLVARVQGVPVQALLGRRDPGQITLAYLVSAPTPEDAVRQVEDGRAAGYHAFKVKVGGHAPAHDVAVARAVVAAAGGGTVWVDANQGYDAGAAREAARGFEALGLRVFEQPVAATDWEGLRALRKATGMVIALDEGAMSLPVVEESLRQGLATGIVVKVAKLGGLHHARQVLDLCRARGVMLLGSGLMDAPLTLAAGLHAFAAAGIEFPCDLNGPQFIAEDYLAEPLPVKDGALAVPARPGLGWEPDAARIDRFRVPHPGGGP